MRAVAQVIEQGFDQGLDTTGRRMVREMRLLGSVGWVGWLLSYLLLPRAARPRGYVWEQQGQVVGNASLFPVESHPERMVIANVAVLPGFRRRGIGSALTSAAVEEARRKKAKQILLQVKHNNLSALRMYRSLGFEPLGTYSTWIRHTGKPLPPPPPQSQIRRREPGEWRAQLRLAQALAPHGPEWPLPLSEGTFRPIPVLDRLGLGSKQHWVWVENGELRGSLSARMGKSKRAWKFLLLESAEELAFPLLDHGLRRVGGSVMLDHPTGQAEEALADLGFHRDRTLTWMRLDLR